MKKYKSICLATPEPIKNMGNLRNYLIENTEDFTAFHFPIGYATKASYVEQYYNGEKIRIKNFPILKTKSKAIKLIAHYIFFTITLFFYTKRGSFVIIDNPFFCFLNSISSFCKKFRFIYFIGDYYPEKTGWLRLYHMLANFYNTHLPFVLYISPPLATIYKKATLKNRYRSQLSLGIQQRFNPSANTRASARPLRLGFIGIIREQQGLDLLFRYIQATKDNACVLEIIGDGYQANHYKALAKDLGIESRVTFHGFIHDPSEIIAQWDIGTALYVNTSDNFSRYCEPTKIKEYLSYGIPVLTTKTTYFHADIQQHGAGEIVQEETVEHLAHAITAIASNYSQYRLGVMNMVQTYAYEQWYDQKLRFLER